MEICPTLKRLIVEQHKEKENYIEMMKRKNTTECNLRNARNKIERLEAEKLVLSHALHKAKEELNRLKR